MPLVCIDCRYIRQRPSGIARVAQALIDFLPDAAPDLDFLLLKHPLAEAGRDDRPNVREVVLAAEANSPTTMWRLPQVIDLTSVDLFHATFNIMPAGLRMPCVTTVHDIMWLTNPGWCNVRYFRPIEQWFYQHGINRALKHATAIATVSEASRRAIIQYAPETESRTYVTTLGVAPDFCPGPISRDGLKNLGIPENKRFVLTVGQYVPYKNHKSALQVFAAIAQDHLDVDMVFVQRLSPRSNSLKMLAQSLGIEDRTHFLPPAEEHQMVLLYRAAAALLHPSFSEGFGLPLLEAMACGCPVVTYNCSAMAEVVGNGGLLAEPLQPVELASLLSKALARGEFLTNLRERGLQRAAGMEWRGFAQQTLKIYRKILQPF